MVQIVFAPQRPALAHPHKVFLAGTTPAAGAGSVDWRQTVRGVVADLPVTVLDPVRPDWGGDWLEEPEFAPFRDQVEWELAMQEQATLVAFYFDPAKDGMVSLLELGLCVGRRAAAAAPARAPAIIAACPPGYAKRGNVRMVCERYGIPVMESAQALADAVRAALEAAVEAEARAAA